MSTGEMRDCKRVFREIDIDGNGMIDFEELKAGLPSLSNIVSELTDENI